MTLARAVPSPEPHPQTAQAGNPQLRTGPDRQTGPFPFGNGKKMEEVTITADWLEVGKVEDIPVLGSRILSRPSGDIAIFRTADDQIFALDNKCPHKGGPLSEGIVHGTRITCPLHNWVMELETGVAVAPDVGETRTWPVGVREGIIYIKLDPS